MDPDPSTDAAESPRGSAADSASGPGPDPDGTGRSPFAPRTLLADGAVAGGVVAGLYGLLYAVPFLPFAVPGYLLIVGFDALEATLPAFPSSAAYDAAFAGFLGVLAVLAALAASLARSADGVDGPRVAAGAALAVVGGLGLLVAAGVFAPRSGGQYGPLLLVVGASLALVLVGRYLAFGRLGRRGE
ncbi:hypothetical protein [Halobaculum sp. EA56]|uniref:hypothetical protein n=1 Tax=Halobaculum sp. EA56 TaxID=3421648 RepID=UPI003EC110A7